MDYEECQVPINSIRYHRLRLHLNANQLSQVAQTHLALIFAFEKIECEIPERYEKRLCQIFDIDMAELYTNREKEADELAAKYRSNKPGKKSNSVLSTPKQNVKPTKTKPAKYAPPVKPVILKNTDVKNYKQMKEIISEKSPEINGNINLVCEKVFNGADEALLRKWINKEIESPELAECFRSYYNLNSVSAKLE
jgi:hypothetical protein